MAYKIANLLQFYLVTMRKTIGENALLSKSLQEWVNPKLSDDFLLSPLRAGSTTSHTRPSSKPSKRRVEVSYDSCM